MEEHAQPSNVQASWPAYELLSVVTHLVTESPHLPRDGIVHAVNQAAALCAASEGRSRLLEIARQRVLTIPIVH